MRGHCGVKRKTTGVKKKKLIDVWGLAVGHKTLKEVKHQKKSQRGDAPVCRSEGQMLWIGGPEGTQKKEQMRNSK